MSRVGEVLVETYRIERFIAEGSMGSVYEARHLRIPKRFAVKFLKVDLSANTEALQRFRREAEVVATLDHPHIVGLFDYNVGDDGVPYIVLEFLDGEDLGVRLTRRRRVPLQETLRIVTAVAGALAAAHAREVIHRDLKPDNIVISAGGVVKVVDFGVAKLRGAPELTAVNTVVGTVPYMAPEQLMGGVLDARVDQYALATIAYEMLAGEMAFSGAGSVTDVARRVLQHVPPFIAGVPQAVNEAIFRGMARAPADRFPDVGALAEALRRAAGEPALHDSAPELPPLAGDTTRVTTPAEVGTLLAPASSLQSNSTPVPLSPLKTVLVDRSGPSAAATNVDPRPTLKTMAAANATGPSWNAVAADATRPGPPAPRLRWMLLGAGFGLTLALLVVLLLR